MISIHRIVNSLFNSCTYALITAGTSDPCWLVDCGDIGPILSLHRPIAGVLLTHCHFDHCYGLNRLLCSFPSLRIITNTAGRQQLLDPRLNLSSYFPDGDSFILASPHNVQCVDDECVLPLGPSLNVHVLSTPGHDPSCLSFLVDDNLFSGDAYIPNANLVDNLPRSDKALAAASMSRLVLLAEHNHLFPGHFVP